MYSRKSRSGRYQRPSYSTVPGNRAPPLGPCSLLYSSHAFQSSCRPIHSLTLKSAYSPCIFPFCAHYQQCTAIAALCAGADREWAHLLCQDCLHCDFLVKNVNKICTRGPGIFFDLPHVLLLSHAPELPYPGTNLETQHAWRHALMHLGKDRGSISFSPLSIGPLIDEEWQSIHFKPS